MDLARVISVFGIVVAVIGTIATWFAWHAEQRRNRDQVAEVRGAVKGAPAVDGLAEGQVATSEEKQLLDNVSNRAAARFKIQIIHYENALVQSATYFWVSLACGILGFGLLVAGVGLAFDAKVPVATVTGAGGILTGAAAALLFKQADRAKTDAQANLSTISDATQRDENMLSASFYASLIKDRDGSSGRDLTYRRLAELSLDAAKRDPVVTHHDSSTGRPGRATVD
jgi:hypothetical protein